MVRKYFGTDGIRGKANEGAMTAETALRVGMAQRDTSVSDLCKELGIERVTLYRYVGPKGELRDHGKHFSIFALHQKTEGTSIESN